jgi:hypothetical protein
MASPGLHGQDFLDNQDPEFLATNLGQLSGSSPFPFHLDKWSDTAAGRYWRPRLLPLADATTDETVAARFAVAQLLPYHAESWIDPRTTIPSQQFTFELVRQAIAREALFVALIGWPRWLAAVPSLSRAEVIIVRNPRNPYCSPGNLGEGGFARVVDRLR